MILNKKTINELKKDFIVCKFCNKKISLKNKRKDMLIGFKSHLRQKHKISLNEYYNLKSKDLCLFCKKNPTNIIISKNQNSKVFIVNYSLCNDKNCINMRKKLNPNSAKYVSIINNCSEKEALKIIHNKNNSPFYKENFLTKEEYLYSQKTYSNWFAEHWLNKGYSEQDAKKKVTKIQKQNCKKFLKKYYYNPDIYAYKFNTKLEYWLNKGYNEQEAKEKLKNRQDVCSLHAFKNRYGNNKGIKKYNTLIQKKSKIGKKLWKDQVFANEMHKKMKTGFSKISQELFENIKNKGINLSKKDMFYALHNKEWFIKTKTNIFFVDFKYKNMIIEFYGDYWHCNPNKFSKNYYNSTVGLYASEIWRFDKNRIDLIKNQGFDILIIWENDYTSNKNKCINTCIKYLRK